MPRTKNVRKVAIRILAVVLALAASVIVVSAYYSSRVYLYNGEDGQKQIFRVGMELNTFFDILDTEAVAENTKLGIACTDLSVVTENDPSHYTEEDDIYVNNTTKLSVMKITDGDDVTYEYVFNPDAEWGSASNPYIISRVTHLQNLCVLQNIGYFKTLCFKDDSAKSEANLPFFLISTNEGKPVVIDGTGMDFDYIGSDAYPFVGYVGGAFDTTATATVNGQTSTQSVIYNLVVNGNGNAVDIGLFGHVGYFGDESAVSDDSFPGVASTIRDFLLYDVRVKVREKTAWTALVDKVAHLFSFSSYDDATASQFPHETHHVGILAGHADYATIEYISVYYSDDNVPAIDVDLKRQSENGVSANFSSVSGVLGFIKVLNATQADGRVGTDGNNMEDVIISGGGAGTGGGLASGTGRGYVTAADIYNGFGDENGFSASGLIMKVTKGKGDAQTVDYCLLVEKRSSLTSYMDSDYARTTRTTDMTLPDGTPVKYDPNDRSHVSTMSVDKNFFGRTSASEERWEHYVVHDLTSPDESLAYYYYAGESSDSICYLTYGTTVTESSVSLKYASQAKTDADGTTYTRLCAQYERERIGTSLTGLTQTTDRYYFYDGVFTFSLSDPSDTIDPTWENGTADQIVVGEDDPTQWTKDENGLPDSVVAFLKPVTSTADLAGKQIFIAYKDGNGYHIVTLAKNSNYNAGGGDNAVTTDKTYLSLASDDLVAAIDESLKNGSLSFEPAGTATLAGLTQDWNDGKIQVLNLGSVNNTAMTLAELKNTYQVRVTQQDVETDENTYEDDGLTVVTSALKNNVTAGTTGTYFSIDSVSELMAEEEYGTAFTFFTLTGSATVNTANVLNVNNVYYEDTGAKITGDAANPLNTRLTIGSAISQTENKIYDAYYYYVHSGLFNSRWSYYYVSYNGTGMVTETLASEVSTGPAKYFTLSQSASDNYFQQNLYTAGGKPAAPVLRQRSGDDFRICMEDSALFLNYSNYTKAAFDGAGRLNISYTATYHYVVKTEKGDTVSYTFDGISTSCTLNGATGEKTTSVYGYPIFSADNAYSKDYDLYSCTVGSTTYPRCLLITRKAIDGILLQTLTGGGVTFTWMKTDGTSAAGAFSIGLDADGNETNLTDTGATVTVDGVEHKVYKTSTGIYGVRLANVKVDGYMTALTQPGEETRYQLNDTTDLTAAPKLLSGVRYTFSDGSQDKSYQLYIGSENENRYLGILFIKVETDESQHTYKFWHESDNENDPYVLDILRRDYGIGSPRYGIICAKDSYAGNTANFRYTAGLYSRSCQRVSYNHDCTVVFNADGTAFLQFTVNGETRYLSYDSAGYFNSTTSQAENAKLYLFALQGTRECSFGDRIVPIAGTEQGSYRADGYVLWPNNVYDKSRDVTVDNGNGTTTTTNETSVYHPANGFMKDTSYSIKSLAELNWRNRSGSTLSYSDLDYVFSLGQGISDVNMLELWGGNSGTLLGADNYVKAPIGTTGEEAYIPTGCVAFRVNRSGANKIRVIVAVPVSSFSYGSVGNELDYATDYSFCMWKVDENPNSALTTYSFSVDNCYSAFELPRSESYDPNEAIYDPEDPSDSSYDYFDTARNVKKYVEITMGGNTYRAYLNGDQVLVAYEFSADEEGVYLLGSTKECRIVYFSADSTASSGNDGVVSSKKIGTIDFVYDNGDYTVSGTGTVTGTAGDRILTVRDINLEVAEDHSQYYYASLALLYTDNFIKVTTDEDAVNGFPNVNDFVVYVRRVSTHGTNDTTIVWQVSAYGEASESDAGYLRFEPYANESTSDALVRKENGLLERENN